MSGGKLTAKRRRNLKLDQCARTEITSKLVNTKLCLSDLNPYVLNHLLLFLDVTSLQQLAKTCTLFDQLISGQFITNLHLPLSKEFLQEVENAEVIEKKPVLRMTVSESQLEAFFGVEPGFIGTRNVAGLLNFQLSLLDLTKLRDLVIKPSSRDNNEGLGTCIFFFRFLGRQLLQALARCGVLCRLTRMEVPVEVLELYHLEVFTMLLTLDREIQFQQMTKLQLISLNLFIECKSELQCLDSGCKCGCQKFLVYFEPFDLTITVSPSLEFTKKKSVVVDLSSDLISIVERLHIIGPCSLQFKPVMESLKEVKVSPIQGNTANCTLPKIPEEDRVMHRPGICCMDVRALWRKCSMVTSFFDISLKAHGHWCRDRGDPQSGRRAVLYDEQSYPQWMATCKKTFFKDYMRRGGLEDLKSWSKTHWNSRKLQ